VPAKERLVLLLKALAPQQIVLRLLADRGHKTQIAANANGGLDFRGGPANSARFEKQGKNALKS
jgi:hypothetical protein